MNRKKELAKNTLLLSLGTFLPKFVTVLVTPILTAKLTKSEYGQYDLLMTIVALLLPAVTLQISSAAFRFLIDKRSSDKDCSSIVSTIFSFVSIVSFFTGLVYFVLIKDKVGNSGILICVYFILDLLLITTEQIIRGLGKTLLYSLSSIMHSVINVILIAYFTGVFHTTNHGLNGVVVALIISTAIPLITILIISGVFRYINLRHVSVKQLKELLSYSWPMVPNNLSGWVLRLSDRLIITAVCGIEANALYAAACKMPSIFSSFQNTFMMAWQESASLALKDNDKDTYYSQMCDWVYRLLIGIMAVLLCFTPIIWKMLIRGDYDDAYYQLPVLYLGILFSCMSSTIGGIYIAHMKTKSIGLTTMLAAIINFTIDILLVRVIGIWAGSFSTMISYLFLLLFRMKDVQKFQKVNFDKKIIVIGIVSISIMGALCFTRNNISNIVNAVLCIIILYAYDKKIITSVIKVFIKKTIKKSA